MISRSLNFIFGNSTFRKYKVKIISDYFNEDSCPYLFCETPPERERKSDSSHSNSGSALEQRPREIFQQRKPQLKPSND